MRRAGFFFFFFSSLIALAFSCGDNLTLNDVPNEGGDAGADTGPTGGDGAPPNDDGGDGGGSESCILQTAVRAGSIDQAFVSEVLRPTNLATNGTYSAHGIAILPDRRPIVVGETNLMCAGSNFNGPHTVLSFLGENGSDSTVFALPSSSSCPTIDGASDELRGLTLSKSGRIFLLGRQGFYGASAYGFTDQLVPTYRATIVSPEGNPTTPPQTWTSYAAVIDDDGSGALIVGGDDNTSIPQKGFVERYVLPAGGALPATEDPAFQGTVNTAITGYRAIIRAAEPGHYLVGGQAPAGAGASSLHAIVRKVAANGVITPFPDGGDAVGPIGYLLALALDGTKIVGLVTAADTSTLFRLSGDGQLDGTFGSGGVFLLDRFTIRSNLAHGTSLVRQCDGKWLVGGFRNNKPAVARILANGEIDPTYGEGGYVGIQPPLTSTNWQITGVALDANQRLLTVSTPDDPIAFIVHRLFP